ncbi:uncharacterized protein LOC134652743 [Cydia amplana]|uniref:uncharacterized protein LOC134652743 n=1 Tax=Cydia amplana TaxID=1869771 RepID=UPI002FE55089
MVVYLDDFLLSHPDPVTLQNQSRFVVQKLEELGWVVNKRKSQLKPTRCLEYLGIIWNTLENKKMLSDSKTGKIKSLIKKLVIRKLWSWREAKVLLGKLNFASFTVPLGRLHCRWMQIDSNKLLKSMRHTRRPISDASLTELDWWVRNIKRSTVIHQSKPDTFITTDAADAGWGAIANNQKLWGRWDAEQQQWHCNQKELWALYETIKWLGSSLRDVVAIWQTDNRTAAAYITKQGGTKSRKLLETTTEILRLCDRYNCSLIARYIPGPYNGLADSLSRSKNLPEWHLKPSITKVVFQILGTPEIDLFASVRSAVVPNYVSEDATDMRSRFTNAFSRSWQYELGWIFPPPALIPRISLITLWISRPTYHHQE